MLVAVSAVMTCKDFCRGFTHVSSTTDLQLLVGSLFVWRRGGGKERTVLLVLASERCVLSSQFMGLQRGWLSIHFQR